MDNKVVIAIVVAAVVICAGAGVAILVGNTSNNDSGVTEGVNYHGNGGKTSEGKTVMGSASHDVIPNIFTYDGYKFASWNTKADGSGTTYNPYGYIEFASGKSVDLYAIWTVDGPMLYNQSSPATDTMGVYYNEAYVGILGVDIPASGPIDIVFKVSSGATNLNIEVTEKGFHRITYNIGTKMYINTLTVKVGDETLTDYDWKVVDGTVVLTVQYDNSDIRISYTSGSMGS